MNRSENIDEIRDILGKLRSKFQELEEVIFELEDLEKIGPDSEEQWLTREQTFWKTAIPVLQDESRPFKDRIHAMHDLRAKEPVQKSSGWYESPVYCLFGSAMYSMSIVGMHFHRLEDNVDEES